MERKLKRFNILLDDESLLYFPGSFLTGQVLLELETETRVRGLQFHIVGEGVVRLKAGGPLEDRETYLDFRLQFLGGPEAGGEDEGEDVEEEEPLSLSPGLHNFPFKLGLPQNLPSTFLGRHGWVQYFCRALLEQPDGLVHKNQQVFIIINPLDLSQEPSTLQQPFYCEAEEELRGPGLICAPRGLVTCKVRLDRGGYVPGECIQVSASVENGSKLLIKRTRASLTETVEYRVKQQLVQSETRELASVERGQVAARSSELWKKVQLQIPALPPSNLRGCHLIRVHYELLFEIHARARPPIRLQLPLVMATYPARNPDGTLRRRKGAQYPTSLPVFRPWLGEAGAK